MDVDVDLKNVKILLVEDEALVGLDLKAMLEDEGARVTGPVMSLADAMARANDADADVALLDIDLRGEDVFPAADILTARRIPFAFHTGHGAKHQLSESYPGSPVCKKPSSEAQIIGALRSLL